MLSIFVAVATHAGPPLVTDDPDTPGPNHWEINVAAVSEREAGEWLIGAPLLDLNYGVGDAIQLKYQVQFNTLEADHQGARAGMGNSLVGVKWRFLDQTNWCPVEVSTYPQLEFIFPNSSIQRGLADAGDNVLLPIEVERKFGEKLTVYAEGGFVVEEHPPDQGFFGIAAEYELSEKFAIMGELYGGFDKEFGKTDLSFNLGFRQSLTKHVALIGAAGRGIFGPSDRNLSFASYLGVQLTF